MMRPELQCDCSGSRSICGLLEGLKGAMNGWLWSAASDSQPLPPSPNLARILDAEKSN